MSARYSGPIGLQTLSKAINIEFFDRAIDLSLRGPIYTDETVRNICHLRCLRSLSLSDARITDSGLARIRLVLPDCRITRQSVDADHLQPRHSVELYVDQSAPR